MSRYNPDRWVVVHLTDGDTQVTKIFTGDYGGYLDADTWNLSSLIVQTDWNEDTFFFITQSGSRYTCQKANYGMSGYMNSIWRGWKDLEAKGDIKITLPEGYGTVH